MKIFDDTLQKLQLSLDLRLERQNLLASNVANADTPGYTPQDFDFARVMAQAESTPSLTMPASGVESTPTGERPGEAAAQAAASRAGGLEVLAKPTLQGQSSFDGNRVNAEEAMVALAENGLQYGATAQAASKKLAILLYTASDGNNG